MHHVWGECPPATHINGSFPIDGCFKSRDLEVTNLKILPFSESLGDHRAFVFDVSSSSILGQPTYKICRPVGRRLVLTKQKAVDSYLREVESQFDIHRIPQRLKCLEEHASAGHLDSAFRRELSTIHKQIKGLELMRSVPVAKF